MLFWEIPPVTRGLFASLAVIAGLAILGLANGAKVEPVGAFADQSASESVRGALESTGYKVSLDSGAEVCRIWLRKGLPSQTKADVQGANFSAFGASSLIGVISFPGKTTDYRGQAIKAGSYTLRYAVHPADGNHMGIAPDRDFLLMVPVTVDQDANAQIKFEDLVKMSAKSAGTNHPAGLNLITAEGQKAFPSAYQDDSNHTVFVAKLKPASGSEIPFALIVKGVADQ
jgi:hypothetical protein